MKINLNNYLKEQLELKEEITLIPIDKIKVIFLNKDIKTVISESLHQGMHYIKNEDFEEKLIVNSNIFIKLFVQDFNGDCKKLIYINKMKIDEIFEDYSMSKNFYCILNEDGDDMLFIHKEQLKEELKKASIKDNINNF